MQRSVNRMLATAVALLLAVTATLVAQAPAHAAQSLAAGCYQSSCNGQDPSEKRCGDDARNLQAFWYQGSSPWLQNTLLELRYSPACDAAWVRTTGGDCFDIWRPCISVLQVQGGSEQWGGPSGGQRWTNMWSFRSTVRGCFRSGTDNHLDGCTAWR